jgi:hypothetical protein
MSKTLYNIADEFTQLLNSIESDEIDESLGKQLEALSIDFDKKAENIVKIIKMYKNRISVIKDEVTRLNDLKSKSEKKIDYLSSYLHHEMDIVGKKNIETNTMKIYIQASPPKVDIINESEIPKKYKLEKTETKTDKNQIKLDINNGIEVKGAILVQDSTLRYK